MKGNLKGFAGGILFSLNIFIVFLLLFENRIVIPLWLQPVGRMHPMILHFPIVILMMAMVLEFFRFKPAYSNQTFYQTFTSNLLIVGAISSAVTVIMGLFLSKEGGYTGDVLFWHKWTGVSITFISSIIYFSRNALWYKAQTARVSAILISFCIIITGHFGATLTHGDNFILEPISAEQERVPINEALVFDHVIKPIFDKKCLSCHNPDKVKGKLLLTDPKSILEGGKTGKLFVSGKPQLSLLLKRIHLPLEDKKHMPPSGKVQLTDEEISLLYLWIKSKPDFKKKVIDLPENDSLRILASTRLKPADDPEEEDFDFASADEETIKKLNNNYRVVAPLAKGSPALAVNLFNKSAFNSNSLEELNAVKKQIISLDLNKMPVKDADLKIISKFENLRKLNLNFTDITGTGLKELASLKHLHSLSLTGTKVTYTTLKQLLDFKKLNKVAIWSTGLKDSEVKRLRNANKRIQFITGFKDDGSMVIKLNPPTIEKPPFVFSTSARFKVKHTIRGTEIRYTLDGSEPDSLKSPVITDSTILTQNATIKAKAFKKGWLSSNVAIYTFYKSLFKPDSILFLTKPDDQFKGNGPRTLINRQSANYSFRSEEWVGFNKNNMTALMIFNKPVKVSSVTMNIMVNYGSFAYPPDHMQVWGGNSLNRMQLLKSIKSPRVTKNDTSKVASVVGVNCSFNPKELTFLKVISKPQNLPAGYVKGKAKTPPKVMLLVNEILIN